MDIEDLSGDTRKFKFRTLDGQGLAGGKAGQYALVQAGPFSLSGLGSGVGFGFRVSGLGV